MTVEPLTVLLADDEPLALRRLQRLVSQVEDVRIVATATDGDQALALALETAAQVVIVDIKMPGRDGVSVARVLAGPEGPAEKPVVIFATAFDRYAIQAFDLAAVDYLLKPFDGPRVAQALARAWAQIRARDAEQRIGELRAIVEDLRDEQQAQAAKGFETELWIDSRGGTQRILVHDLDWIEAERDYVRLHVGARSYLVRDSIRGLVERLDPEVFVRIHRSAVVRRDRVAQLTPRPGGGLTVVLSTGARPPVGRSHAAAVRRLFRRTASNRSA